MVFNMSLLREFKDFALRGNVVDVAVGFIIGAAFGKIITSLVSGVLMPPIGMILGAVDFSRLEWPLGTPVAGGEQVAIKYGAFINTVIDFVIVAFVIFLVIKAMNRFAKRESAAPPPVKNCPECLLSIPINAKRCGHCTSAL